MNKGKKYFMGAGLILVVVTLLWILYGGKSTAALPKHCQTKTADNVSLPKADDIKITYAVMFKKQNVPAGTNANVYYREYSADNASGTITYAGTYGSYNFRTTRSGDWKVIAYAACN